MTLNTPAGGTSGTPPSPSQIQVMLVDDSAVVRGFISRILQSDPDIAVVLRGPVQPILLREKQKLRK